MTSLRTRSVLPAATIAAAIAGVFFLANAVAHVVVVAPAASAHAAGLGAVQAEIRACMAGSGRSHDDCLDEIEGKALIQHAEWLAQNSAQPADDDSDESVDADAAAHPPRSRAP